MSDPKAPEREPRHRRHAQAGTLLGLGSLVWLLLRTGSKPQRISYPCQQAALASSFGALSYLAALAGLVGLRRLLRPRIGGAAAGLLALVLLAVISVGHPGAATPARAAVSGLPGWTSATAVSNVFVVQAVPPAVCSLDGGHLPASAPCNVASYAFADRGVDVLVQLMDSHGNWFHKTAAHPTGLFGASDVVVIKVNNQWGGVGGVSDGRLATNNDVLKGVIWRVLQHPDGFTGEVVVAENTQGANANWDNNATDQNQSYQDVVDAFRAQGYSVSFSTWDELNDEPHLIAGGSLGAGGYQGEYAGGNNSDGYVLLDDPGVSGTNQFSYPKFTTTGGRRVSLRYGLWNGSSYDATRVKLINLPVLKKHCMAGATVSWKNYIGFVSIADNDARFGGWDPMHDFFWGYTGGSNPNYGLIGREMSRIRVPALNIVDAVWVATESNYEGAVVRQDALVASTDPFAADWYSSEYILRPVVPLDQNPSDSSAARAGTFRHATRVNQTAAKATWSGTYPWIELLDSCETATPCQAEKNEMNVYVSANEMNLGITKTDGQSTVVAGQSTVYTIAVTNAGPGAALGARVTDSFPAAVTAVSWTCTATAGGACGAASGTGGIDTTVNVPVGGTVTFVATATVSVSAVGSLSNTASVAAPAGFSDPSPVNNTASDTDTILVPADISVTKTDGRTTASAGDAISYTIVVSNAGPNGVNGVSVVDTMPASLLPPVSWTCAPAGGANCNGASGSGSLSQSVNLPAGGSVTYTVTGTLQASPAGLSNTVTATLPASYGDPHPGDTTATDTDLLVCANERRLVADGRDVQIDLASTATQWLLIPAKPGRSYSLEVRRLTDSGDLSEWTLFSGDVGCSGSGTAVSTDTRAIDPGVANGMRLSFTASGSDGHYRLRLVNGADAARYSASLSETTLFSPAWSTNGTYNTYYSLQNTTSAVITAKLLLTTTTGTAAGETTLAIPAGATVSTNTSALAIARSSTGTTLLTHDGPPGALLAEAAIANFGFTPAYVQPVRFRTMRENR